MAYATGSYFSNSLAGNTNIGTDVDIYEVHTSPKYAVGFGITRSDGAKFRYCHFGAMTSQAGLVVATDYSESSAPAVLGVGVTAAPPTAVTAMGGESVKANAKGSRYMQLTITASADQFEGGYVTVISGTGYGFTYRIRGNTVSGTPAATSSTFELYDPIQAALDGTQSACAVVGCPYANVETATAADPFPAGVSVSCVSANGYGWVQTRGIIGVKTETHTATPGSMVVVSTNTTGTIEVLQINTATALCMSTSIIGTMVHEAAVDNYSVVYLTLE